MRGAWHSEGLMRFNEAAALNRGNPVKAPASEDVAPGFNEAAALNRGNHSERGPGAHPEYTLQ